VNDDYDFPYSEVIKVDDDYYLFQGETGDELTMFRSVDDLLMCERDQVQKMLGGKNR